MRRGMRRFLAAVAAVGMLAAGLVAVEAAVTTPSSAEAADLSKFDPGNIISDTVFFNPSTMTVAQIQAFLKSKVSTCRTGYTCLINYKQDTPNRPKDPMCAGYTGAKNESAATIIYKVAKACNVNPQVILVTLQKEQGFITDDWPSARMYRSAMGYGCPDTADCDINYYGFFNQVYTGTWAFQRYTMPKGTGPGTEWYSTFRQYAPGKTVNVRYHPDASCGTKAVRIQNEATSSLYTYTPYTPNAAALNAGYGLGNGCSAYGNRNFFNYFVDWFGSTQGYAADAKLKALWDSTGGSTGLLGYATNVPVKYSNGGIGQEFQRGWAYWHQKTGAYRTSGAIGQSYIGLGGPTGTLGYPTADMVNDGKGGYSQKFQNGAIFWSSARGTQHSSGGIYSLYTALGGAGGTLGYPAAGMQPEPGGYSQVFESGAIFWSGATGAVSVPKVALSAYADAGGPGGKLGFPLAEPITAAGGQIRSEFEKGTISWSSTTQPKVVMRAALKTDRISGDDRYWTAVAISKSGYPKTANVVYVTTGNDYPDALAAAPAAAKQGGPLLLTIPNRLPDVVKNEIKRLQPKSIVVVGGTSAVSNSVMDVLKTIAPTKRLGGTDRFDTARKVISNAFPSAATAYLATGMDFPDALSASAAAGAIKAPVMLVDGRKNAIDAPTEALLTKLGVTRTIIAGGTGVVTSGIQTSLKAFNPARRAGADRYETSRLINKAAFPTTARAYVASASQFPDALTGAAMAGAQNAPVYVVAKNCLASQVLFDITVSSATRVSLLGGPGVLTADVSRLNTC